MAHVLTLRNLLENQVPPKSLDTMRELGPTPNLPQSEFTAPSSP